jgi:hypothetical protein
MSALACDPFERDEAFVQRVREALNGTGYFRRLGLPSGGRWLVAFDDDAVLWALEQLASRGQAICVHRKKYRGPGGGELSHWVGGSLLTILAWASADLPVEV